MLPLKYKGIVLHHRKFKTTTMTVLEKMTTDLVAAASKNHFELIKLDRKKELSWDEVKKHAERVQMLFEYNEALYTLNEDEIKYS